MRVCVTVLQRPDTGQQRWDERDPGEDQSDPDGEVPQAAGRPPNTGRLTHTHTQVYTGRLTHTGKHHINVSAVGVVGQRAGEERHDGS